jgi:hypothetical protein
VFSIIVNFVYAPETLSRNKKSNDNMRATSILSIITPVLLAGIAEPVDAIAACLLQLNCINHPLLRMMKRDGPTLSIPKDSGLDQALADSCMSQFLNNPASQVGVSNNYIIFNGVPEDCKTLLSQYLSLFNLAKLEKTYGTWAAINQTAVKLTSPPADELAEFSHLASRRESGFPYKIFFIDSA